VNHPTWSPDGSRLLYTENNPYYAASNFYIHSFAGGPDKLLGGGESNSKTAWSPDGSKIAFTMGGGLLGVMNADGTGLRPLTIHGLNDGGVTCKNPSWSPDGRKIAFERYDGKVGPYGITNIFVVDAIGGEQSSPLRQLTTGPYNGAPSWANVRYAPVIAPPTIAPPTLAPQLRR